MSRFSLFRNAGPLWGTAELWTPAKETRELSLWTGDPATIITSGGLLTQWSDTSGNNRHATVVNTARRPTISETGFNGKVALGFNGSQEIAHGLTSVFSPGAKTIIAFYQTLTAQTSYRGVFAIPTGANGSMLLARTGSGFIGSYGTTDINSTSTYAPNSYYMVVMEDNQLVTGTKSFRVNGSVAGTYTANPTGATGLIGGDVSQGQGLNGLVRGIWVIPGTGNTTIVEKFEGWALHDVGLASMLPVGHPYKSSPPTA